VSSSRFRFNINVKTILLSSIFLVIIFLNAQPLSLKPLFGQNDSSGNTSSSLNPDAAISLNNNTGSNATAQSPVTISSDELDEEMKKLSTSDNPVDIATFLYVWGYPLITNLRTIDYSTDPEHYSESEANGPWNVFQYRTKLADANFTQFVTPNVDTLYSNVYYDITKEPIVIQIPNGIDRYFTLQFIDAFTNNYHYLGTRTTGTNGGIYLLTGPDWKGTVPEGMTEIKSPTNFGLIFGRTLVNGQDDLNQAIEIQQSIKAAPLPLYEHKSSIVIPEDPIVFYPRSISGLPEFIPPTGVKVFNELAYYLANNMPPANQSEILRKAAEIGIVPNANLTNQSAIAFNSTISSALLQGISNGEKLIDDKAAVLGKIANGWAIATEAGKYPDDYLTRSAFAKYGLWGNSAVESVYPNTFNDGDGKPLNGTNNYILHFGKGELPPVGQGGFWSITLYNEDRLLTDNPIDRYVINDRTQGLKYNADGSLDLYLQNQKPTDPQKEANWFPSPDGPFSLTMRIYIPTESVLTGQYAPPPVQFVS
jgi:hypothetical protein